MTATQLALGIFFGLAGVEVFKVLVAMAYETQKRNAARADMQEMADDFIDKMHRDLMADRQAEEAKKAARRKSAARAKITKPVTKSPVRRTAATKKASK